MTGISSPERSRRYVRKRYNNSLGVDRQVAAGFLRLLKAGIAPSSKILVNALTGEDGMPKLSYDSVNKGIIRLGNKLPGQVGFVTELLEPGEEWPADMPIQTLDDLAETITHSRRNQRTNDLYQRLPVQVREWVENNPDPTAFPQIQFEVNKARIRECNVHTTEFIIFDRLAKLTQPADYLYADPMDAIPELAGLDAFKAVPIENLPSYVRSVMYVVPGIVEKTAEIRNFALEKGEDDPTKTMVIGKVFEVLESTHINPDHTLAGISRQNLSFFLSRTLPFDQMRRKIIAESNPR